MLAQLSLHEGHSVRNIPAHAYEMLRFLSDIQATFRYEKHGVVGQWQYSSSLNKNDPVRGAALWEEFLKAPNNYYLLPNEIRLIQERVGQLLSGIDNPVVLVDFGQGPAQTVLNKTVPIMRHLSAIAAYCPLDTCKDYIIEAGEIVSRERPGIRIDGYHVDYYRDEFEIPKIAPALGLFFGGTIGNVSGHPNDGLPEAQIVSYLRRIKRILGNNAYLIMTNDTNQDETSILQSYCHEMQIAFGSNLMHRIKRDLPISGGFNPESWHYEPVWHAENHQLCHTIVCDQAQKFMLGKEKFNIEIGERFILNNSFKFPVEKIIEWAKKVGFESQKRFMDHENRQAIYLFKACLSEKPDAQHRKPDTIQKTHA